MLISISVDHFCPAKNGFGNLVRTVDVDVAVQMVIWLEDRQNPTESFYPLVGQIRLVMDSPGGGVGDEDM